jgi:hypothetical protein
MRRTIVLGFPFSEGSLLKLFGFDSFKGSML